jgi:pimeloyl-ACP methyl ester carboxylesterase
MSKTFESEHFYGNLNQEQIEQISSKYVETIKRFSEDVWKKFWSSVDDFNGFQILQNLKIPIWEIYGNCGLRTDDYNNSLLIPKSPYIKLEWIPDAGHFLPHEKPVETATFCQKL